MARREVLDEEPFDIDLDEEEKVVDLSEDDEGGDDEEEEEKPSTRKSKNALTDEDLDRWEKDKRDLTNRTQAAEAAAREAADVAAAAVDRLEKQNQGNNKQRLEGEKAKVASSIVAKRAALKAAFEEGDADKHAALTEEMADLKGQERLLAIAEDQLKNQKQPAPAKPKVHPKAEQWLTRNDWFKTNEEARMAAVSYGNMLERSGVSPSTDAYYEKVDANMRKRFPELFDDVDDEDEKSAKKPTTVVKSVERSGGAGAQKRTTKVKLSPLQVKIAKQWGIDPKLMAKEVVEQRKREQGN